MIIILAKSRYFDGPGLVVTDESGKEAVPGFIPPHPDTGTVVNRLFWFVFRKYDPKTTVNISFFFFF